MESFIASFEDGRPTERQPSLAAAITYAEMEADGQLWTIGEAVGDGRVVTRLVHWPDEPDRAPGAP